jgi:hypothetical protein
VDSGLCQFRLEDGGSSFLRSTDKVAVPAMKAYMGGGLALPILDRSIRSKFVVIFTLSPFYLRRNIPL